MVDITHGTISLSKPSDARFFEAFFTNPQFGEDLNQSVGFSGTPVLIHNGGTSPSPPAWVPTATAGAWNFADAGTITLTNGDDGDQADFTSPSTLNPNSYVDITGSISVSDYSSAQNSVDIFLTLAGAQKGLAVRLDVYFDPDITGVTQNFIVPTADFAVPSGELIDGFRIVYNRSGGGSPTRSELTFDDLTFQELGGAIEYKITIPAGLVFYVTSATFYIADDFSIALANGTVPGLDDRSFFGVPSLANGFVLRTLVNGVAQPGSQVFRNFGDMKKPAVKQHDLSDNGVRSSITLVKTFDGSIPIEDGVELSVLINDDLSGLAAFTIVASGRLEPK